MARLRLADGADKAALGPPFTGDSPGNGPPRPLPVSLVLRPVQAASAMLRVARLIQGLQTSKRRAVRAQSSQSQGEGHLACLAIDPQHMARGQAPSPSRRSPWVATPGLPRAVNEGAEAEAAGG